MRVIAGSARSVPLMAPAGMDTRPTTDKIKETLFNMIHFDLPDCTFLDLYSGSGAIGIEAVSRGAKHAYLVDNSKKACECIKANVLKCHFEDYVSIIARDAADSLYEIHDKLDIVFMDPPYELGMEESLMKMFKTGNLCHEDTLFIIESTIDRDFSGICDLGYEITKVKEYKTNKHTFFKFS